MAAQYYFNIEKDLQSAEDGYQSGRGIESGSACSVKAIEKIVIGWKLFYGWALCWLYYKKFSSEN